MRSHYCGLLREADIGTEVTLCGWAHRRRDHGGVIFIDLRDREGLAQVVFDPGAQEHFQCAETVRAEYVLRVRGVVRAREASLRNPALPTGAIEVHGQSMEILNEAEPVPFQLDGHIRVGEEVRLRHRYVDLRRPELQRQLRLRARAATVARGFLEEEGLLEVETPVLTSSTPEGARDYLAPSRLCPGNAYALAQSPQLFKQMLMIGGLDRYYQFARCFRDEDLRADRQPEFTQLDIELSFVDESGVMALAETLLRRLFAELLEVELPSFTRLGHAEALERYGSDRPDLRIDLPLVELGELMRGEAFEVFRAPAEAADCRVAALRLPGGGALTRREIDGYTTFVGEFGARGLAWIKVKEIGRGAAGLQSPILKFLSDQALSGTLERLGAEPGDILFFGAGERDVVNRSLGALRERLGVDRQLAAMPWAPVWVVDFPLFERDADGGWTSPHHPFTAPACSVEALREAPGEACSRAYDLVLNGTELGGGSIRIHRPEMQRAVFSVLGLDAAEVEDRFGFLLRALSHGCPPHGGIAFGLDRLVMLLSGGRSIRDVIAFPKTQNGQCLLTGAPSPPRPGQWATLGLRRIS